MILTQAQLSEEQPMILTQALRSSNPLSDGFRGLRLLSRALANCAPHASPPRPCHQWAQAISLQCLWQTERCSNFAHHPHSL